MDGQRQRDPLVLLDAAVIVRVQIGHVFIFVERILLDVQAGRINVCAEDVHALFQRLTAELECCDGLFVVHRVELGSGGELHALFASFVHADVAVLTQRADGIGDGFALGFAQVEVFFIIGGYFFEFRKIFGAVLRPGDLSVHKNKPSFPPRRTECSRRLLMISFYASRDALSSHACAWRRQSASSKMSSRKYT